MITADIQKKIRHLEISTRRLLSGSLIGDSRSAIKGFGFDFDQIREYRAGDDVRFIDWKSSSRTNQLLVKQYIEERNRRIIIAVDVSGSRDYGSTSMTRAELHAQIAAVLTLVAAYGNDSVGLLLFSDEVEYFLPPERGRAHTHAIIEKLFSYTPRRTQTKIECALTHLARLRTKNAMVFMISDFIDSGFEKRLRSVTHRYDCIALRCIDQREQSLQHVGFLTIHDPETGNEYQIDIRAELGKQCTDFLRTRLAEQERIFKRNRVDLLDMEIGTPFMANLVTFFRRRMLY